MLDIALLRKDPEAVARRLADRGYQLDVSAFQALEEERRAVQSRSEALQARRNSLSKTIGQLKGRGEDVGPVMAEVAGLGAELEAAAAQTEAVLQQQSEWLAVVPNLPQADVPVGRDEHGNVELRRWHPEGRDPAAEVRDGGWRDHADLAVPLGMDFETGARLAGARFTVLRGQMARVHRALAQYMLDTHVTRHGYVECYVPYVVNAPILFGTGQLPKFADDLFSARKGGAQAGGGQAEGKPSGAPGGEQESMYLIPTSEVPLTSFVRDQIVAGDELPIRLTAHTPCFRSEAGSYGRDTRGFIRQHQFDKVEMVQIVHPEQSAAAFEEMVGHAEAILQGLKLPYRAMQLCTGDMGFSAARTIDLEVWLPGQQAYREISSISNCEAFQARRMRARCRTAQGRTELLHTLNGSGLAVGRTLVAVLENGQQPDGSVRLPEVLHPYLGGLDRLLP